MASEAFARLFEKWLGREDGWSASADEEATARGALSFAIEACAAEVEAAGKCICPDLTDTDNIIWDEGLGEWDPGTEEHVVQHDPRCPRALAARLRGLA